METANKIKIAKGIARAVVKYSVSGVVVTAIHNITPTYDKKQKAQLYIGAYVVGSMVADKAEEHIDSQIDALVEAIETIKGKAKTENA